MDVRRSSPAEIAAMVSARLKQLRLALGLSLDDLVAKIGRLVSKQALSKYERGMMVPSPSVLTRIAEALGVKAAYFLRPPQAAFSFLGFRKQTSLRQRERSRLQNRLVHDLEKRIRLCTLTRQTDGPALPVRRFAIRKVEDAERAAERLRALWSLGIDPIRNLIQVLEGSGIHVLCVPAHQSFDGISAIGTVREPQFKVAAVVVRDGVPGDRQRLSLAHELGHLVLRVDSNVNEERAAFRFAGSFLAPAAVVRAMVGIRRTNIDVQELILLKRHFGMSVAALIHRLRDLEIIGRTEYRAWWTYLKVRGWRKEEPEPPLPEMPQWIRRTALRAKSEGLISTDEATELSGQTIRTVVGERRITPRMLLKLPPDERRGLIERSLSKFGETVG